MLKIKAILTGGPYDGTIVETWCPIIRTIAPEWNWMQYINPETLDYEPPADENREPVYIYVDYHMSVVAPDGESAIYIPEMTA